MKRISVEDICLGDKFEDNGMVYDVKAFHGSTKVFVEGQKDEDDHYRNRDERLLKKINEYYLKKNPKRPTTATPEQTQEILLKVAEEIISWGICSDSQENIANDLFDLTTGSGFDLAKELESNCTK